MKNFNYFLKITMKQIDGKVYDILCSFLGDSWGTAIMSLVKTFVSTFVGFLIVELIVFFGNPKWEAEVILSILYAALVGALTALLRTGWNGLSGRYKKENL